MHDGAPEVDVLHGHRLTDDLLAKLAGKRALRPCLDGRDRRRYELGLPGIGSFNAEIVTHRYAWEGHHSTTNQQGGHMVPSRLMSAETRLTVAPDNLDHVDADGRLAARVFLAPEHFESGSALYVRRDILEHYAKCRGREVVLMVRGERQPEYELISQRPRWYVTAARARADEWAFAKRLKDLD